MVPAELGILSELDGVSNRVSKCMGAVSKKQKSHGKENPVAVEPVQNLCANKKLPATDGVN